MSDLALKLIEKERKEKTGKLDLGNCGLKVLPKELFELIWLEELSLVSIYEDFEKENKLIFCNNQEAQNEFESKVLTGEFRYLPNLKKIYLGDYINSFSFNDCNSLIYCSKLQYLNLSGNNISDFSFLNYLPELKYLDISSNNISEMCSIEKLTLLKYLDLGSNQLSNLSFLNSLTTLETLCLNSNLIIDVFSLKDLRKLQSLVLNNNKIQNIDILKNLKLLSELNISNNDICDFNPISELIFLDSLDLSYNNIKNIEFLRSLKSITTLKLHNNQILDYNILQELPLLSYLLLSNNKIQDTFFLSKLQDLKWLVLNNCEIKNYSVFDEYINLKSLEGLHLDNDNLTEINFIKNLTNLKHLSITSNKIFNINTLRELTLLDSLDLSNNEISDITDLIPLLKMKKQISVDKWASSNNTINLYQNPIINPPISIVKRGTEAVLDWFEQIEIFGAEPFFESKLMILGQGGAGKSTFANLQLDSNYIVKPGSLDSTLGIVVHKGKEFRHTNNHKNIIKAHLWDFGGQDIQKMLHQFFITENCLYVLVSDKRAENTNFDYWFQIINLLGSQSSVIVLENPKECKGANENFAINKYRDLYPDLNIETIELNLSETRGKDNVKWIYLNDIISQKLSQMEIVNRLVPKKWVSVRNELFKLIDKRYISKDDFYKIGAKSEIGLNHRQADWCLDYFRSLGDLVYFEDRELCTHIFLDHNWLTKGMYYILSDKKIQDDGGRFTRSQAYSQWDEREYNEGEKAMLLRLLLKDTFDICYELPDEKDVFISPLLLPTDKPAKWIHETNLRFRYRYGFIPHGLFSRLIVQLHDKIDFEQPWKTGVRLKDLVDGKYVYAEIQQYLDPDNNQQVIDVKINGNKNCSKHLLTVIRNSVEKLNRDFNNIVCKEIIACNCSTCIELMKKGEKPSFFDFEMLQDKILNRSYFVECEKSKWKPVNIGYILNDIVVENAGNDNRDVNLLNRLKDMGMSINQITNINNNQISSSSSAISNATAINTVTIQIQTILGEVESLKEDFEDERKFLQKELSENEIDITIRDIEKAENALKEIENAQKENQIPTSKSKYRFKRFIDDLSNEDSTLYKGLKLLRKEYGVSLAETYNNIAGNLGLPLVPPLALDIIKKI